MNRSNYLSRYDALYWRMMKRASAADLFRREHTKGAYKANLAIYGRKPAPGTEADRIRLSGRG